MRLSERLRTPIKAALRDTFGAAPVYLFGSRADDGKRGGDIDLAVATSMAAAEFRSKKIKFIANMIRNGWELKIDLVQFSDETDALLKSEIRATGIPFN